MKKISISLLCSLLFSQVTTAALPPTAESLRRMKAVIESNEVYDKLGSANWVESLSGDGEKFILKSRKCQLEVTVTAVDDHTKAPGFVGPAPLEVKVGAMKCQ